MKIRFIVAILILTFYSFGQERKSQFTFDFSEVITRYDNSVYFNKNELSIGRIFDINKKNSFEIDVSYCLSGNLAIGGGSGDQTYKFRRHYLGTKFTYNFWDKNMKVRPFLSIALFTGIGTNYKNKYLTHREWLGLRDDYATYGTENIARWYKGTPIVIDFLFGVSTKLTSSLNLKTAFGLGNEKITSRTLTWNTGEIENPMDEIENGHKRIDSYFSWNLLIGLQYTFSFNKSLN